MPLSRPTHLALNRTPLVGIGLLLSAMVVSCSHTEPPTLDGRWLVDRTSDDRQDAVLEIEGTHGRWFSLHTRSEATVIVSPGPSPTEFLLEAESVEGSSRFRAVLRDDGTGLLFRSDDDALWRLFEVTEVPASLHGDWSSVNPTRPHYQHPFGLTAGALEDSPGEPTTVGVRIRSNEPVLAWVGEDGIDIVYLVPIADGYLSYADEPAAYIVMHRSPGNPLGWVGADSGVSLTQNVCEQAAVHMEACMVRYCRDAPQDDPICRTLHEPRADQDVPPCDDELAPMAEELLGQTCEELLGD